MKCHCCNRESDYLERINPTGEIGLFYCKYCFNEHKAAIKELKAMSIDELNLVPYTTVKWVCQSKGCNRGTTVRDYGIAPDYFSNRMGWVNTLQQIFHCAKHWKLYRRLIKNYPLEDVQNKMLDYSKERIIKN